MGLFSSFLPFSYFLFSALTLDLKPFPHPLNQILEQEEPDEHNVPKGALGFFPFLQDKDSTDRTFITERGKSGMSLMEAGGAHVSQGEGWVDTNTSFLQ